MNARGGDDSDTGKMRFFQANDPAIFRARVVAFVNFDDSTLRPLEAPENAALVLARSFGSLDQSVRETLAYESGGAIDPELLALIEMLPADNPAVLRYRGLAEDRRRRDGLSEGLRALVGLNPGAELVAPRAVVEHVAIVDDVPFQTLDDMAEHRASMGDVAGAREVAAAKKLAQDMGIADIRALEEFPIALCTYGYTRVSVRPDESVLNTFPSIDTRIPLYTIATRTEGIYVRLDPRRAAEWLRNNFLIPDFARDADPWSVLVREADLLSAHSDRIAAAALRALLHTISHALLRNIEWSGYRPQSVGEYLMPEALAVVLYANRHTATKIGGLLTLVEQRGLEWLEGTKQLSRECMFDPFCSDDDGGSCVGCLFREHNCPNFNGELSRSLLFGGNAKVLTVTQVHRIDIRRGFWE